MNQFAKIPSVSRVLENQRLAQSINEYGHSAVTRVIRNHLEILRQQVSDGVDLGDKDEIESGLIRQVIQDLQQQAVPNLRPVFNLTGTVLHTNLGRASLPPDAIAAMVDAARYPCALEYDLETGGRGDRDALVEELLCELTGAEAATVVNNNAAAVFLTLNTLASAKGKKQVIVSRGELIEIGGAFRVPDIMSRSGAKLVEVGTTNRTHLKDFQGAITSKTAMLMKIHTSNYEIQGFTHAVPEKQLAELAHKSEVPFVVDLGSGTLAHLEDWGLPHEPTPRESIEAGADLVTFSGDKLLGGPQAGLLVGKRALIEQIKKNPLKRALRVGKITLAALEAVLRLYRNPDSLQNKLATLQQLTRPQADIQAAAERLLPMLQSALQPLPVSVEVVLLNSQIGSGSLPVERLPSAGLSIRSNSRKNGILHRMEAALRKLERPVIGRIDNDAMLLDLRCLAHEDEAFFIRQLSQLAQMPIHETK
ncbi:L-seryl-tRNA(Sec) selenium transferase [Thiomicrorhabdus cannonii]|uniref:L-seryl-tRNA(Sec) selenium transferase n=1 Tax=Thiomicrorhabdus cannonii TaxID=2748011 RepID=UPI0015BD66D0|nr:L-seryl-tRNA(Sec) selenium transferase [Thiomicrorhabdus cannonii]